MKIFWCHCASPSSKVHFNPLRYQTSTFSSHFNLAQEDTISKRSITREHLLLLLIIIPTKITLATKIIDLYLYD